MASPKSPFREGGYLQSIQHHAGVPCHYAFNGHVMAELPEWWLQEQSEKATWGSVEIMPRGVFVKNVAAGISKMPNRNTENAYRAIRL